MSRCPKAEADRKKSRPSFEYESLFWKEGLIVAGVDEVGRGCLAGPVVAAACILPPDCSLALRDSKELSPKKRALFAKELQQYPHAIAYISAPIIDEINILEATKEAMRRAIAQVAPQAALIDGLFLELDIPSEKIIKGDQKSLSIAAASILAKESRDAYMREQDELYPHYGFIRHVGYGTQEHREALIQHGPCPLHRMSFAPLKK